MITLKTKHFKVVTSSIHPLIQQIPNFVQHFLKNEKHPFYELLSDCSKSCEKYVSSISEIERFMSMVDNNPDHLWDVTNKSTTQRKTVRGQSVSCTCNYSVTNFNSSSAQRLERDFEKSHHYLHDVLLKRVSKQKQSEIAMVNYFKNFMDTINLQDNHNNLVAMLDLLFYWLRETDHKMGLNHKFRSEVIKMIEIGILVLKKYGVYQDHFYIFGQLINTRGSSEWGLNLISLPTEWDAGSILYVKQLLECIINPISSALKDKSYYLNEKDFLKYLDYLPMNQVLQTLLLNWPRLIFDHEKTCNLIYTFAQIYTYGLIKITGRSSISKLLGSKLKLVILTFCHYLQKKHYSLRNNTNNQIIYPDPFAYYRNNNFYENDIDFSLFKKHFSSFSTLDQIFLDNMLINLIVLINKSKDRSLIKYFEPFPFHTCSIKTCWKLLGILIGRYDATQGLEPSYENWKLLITEMPQIHQNYSDFLNNKHSTHLFKILLKISFAQPFWLISIIAEEIYWGSFINQNNKNIDKNINDPLKILNEMCLSNPRLISMLFRQTIKNFDKINVNYQLIWSNLPLSLWNLNIIDFNYFKQFFKYNINEKRFQFIYFLLTKLNYEFKSINKNRLNTFRKNQLLKFQNYQNFKKVTIDLKEAENENENDNKNKKKKPKKKKKKKKKTDPYNKVKSVKLHKWSNIKIPTEFSEFQFQRKLENSNNDNNNINNENNDEKEVTNNENDNENKKKENNKIDEEIIELENKENTNKFNGNFQINLNFDEFDNNNTTTNNNNTINNNNNTTTNNNITTTNNNNNTNDINTTTTTDINTTTTNTTNNNDTNIINENNNKEINIINENNDINIINENNTNENKEIEIEKSQENQNINDEIKTLEETLKPEELNLPIFLLPNIHIKLAILIMKFYFKSIYNNNDLKKNQKKEYTNFCWKYIQKIKVYNKFGMPFEDLINYPNDERFSFEKYIKSFLSIEDPFIAYCLLKFTNIWNYDAINFLFDILIKNKQFYYLSEILLYRIPLLINDNLNISLQEGNEKETEENQEEKKKKEKEKEINYNIFYKLTNKIFNPIDNLINNNNNLPETNLIDLNNKKIKIKTKINFFSIISQIQMTQRIFLRQFEPKLTEQHILQFWLTVITQFPNWNKEEKLLELLNNLFKNSILTDLRPIVNSFLKCQFLKQIVSQRKYQKKKLNELNQNMITLIHMGRTMKEKARKNLLTKFPFFYFEVVLVELLIKSDELKNLTKIIKKYDFDNKKISIKKFLKSQKIKTNFEILNWWFEFAIKIEEKDYLLFPIIFQTLFSILNLPFNNLKDFNEQKDRVNIILELCKRTNKKKFFKSIVERLDLEIKNQENKINNFSNNSNIYQTNQSLSNKEKVKLLIYIEFKKMINNYIEDENEENSYKINQNDNLLNAKAQIKMDNLINYNLIKNFKINPLSKINIPKLFQLNTQFWFDLMNKTELFNEFELNQLLFYDLDKYILYLNHVENNKKNKKKNQKQNSGNEIENYLCKPNNQLFFSHFFNTNFYKIQKIIKYCDQYIEMTKKMDFNKEFKIVEDSIIKNNKIFKNNLQNAYNQANIDQNSNLDAIQRELTNYLNSFFKYYHQFHENKKIHKNLDKEFLRKSRQLYRNVPVTINKTESITIPVTETYTTNEGTTSTRTRYDHETVHFTFHVTEIQKDNGVYHDIIRNRDQVTEYTNLSRNPNRKLPDETIKSIYFFEKWHSFLKLNVNLTKLAYEWSIKFNLFEESGNGKTLSHYSPWKHFRKHFTRLFSNSFILNNPLVLKDILLLILQNPHARIKNFSKYFNPNCNNELFIELFNLVFNHYNKQSKSNKKDFSKLFKNFNFQLYLNQLLPNEQFCNQFLMTFYSMINFQTFKDFLKIHNCFVNYLGQFLLYNFPVNYFNILNQIMKLFAIGESVPQLWAILLTIPQNYLKLDLVINTKTILTQNFNLKLQQLSTNKSNLYLFLNNPNIKYHSKVSSVATIIQFFEKLILSLPTELRNTEKITLQNIENVNYFSYKILIDLFNPFINNNYLINNNPYPAFIINKDQLPEISNLFQSFCKQLNFLNSNFLNVINYFFNDFSLNFVQNTPDIIADNVSNVLAFNINWTQLIINFNVLNHMIKISNTNWNRIIRLIIAKVNWLFYEKQLLGNNNNNNNNNNNLENENNFHSMLFESICNVILNYSDFDIPIQYNNFVIMINNIINQINWNNYLKYEKYNSYLEFLTVDTKLINYNKDNRKGTNYLKEIKYNENMFTKEIKNKEQQLFLFIYFLKKIINFDNINNFNFKSTFCKTITKILELSSTILLLEDKIEIKKRRFRKNQEITLKRELPPVKQVSILSFELFETNFIKIWLELIKLSILNSDNNNNNNNNVDNLQFPFDLILKNIINPQIQISLIENLCFFIEQNNKFSLPILKSISLEPKLIKNSIAVGETCILVYMNSYTNNWDFPALISHFNFIDVDQDQLTTNCIEQFAFTTVWLYLKKKFLSNVNNDNEQDNSTFKFDIIKSTEILNTIILKNKLKYGKEFTYILIVNLLFKYLNVANNLIDDNDFWKTIKYNLQFIAKKFEDLYNEKNTKDTLIDFDDSKLDLNYRLAFFTISTLINNGFAKPTNELIFQNETNKKTTKNAQNSLNNLTKLANNKHFKIFDKQINIFSEFITNNELTINNCLQLISHISNKLFTNHNDNFLTYFIN